MRIIGGVITKLEQLTRTLKIEGSAPTRAFTTTFMPSILAMALNGLKALKVRIVLKMEMFPAPNKLAAKFTSETPTMMKSSQHLRF